MKYAHISTEEVKQDIADTQREIIEMERQIEGYTLIGDKLSLFKADGKKSGVQERKNFIAKLELILKEREG